MNVKIRLREAALEYETIPAYGDLDPVERDRWKAYLPQKLGKPKNEASPEDWDEINKSWKIPSLVWTALDAGLRPIEVGRAKTRWLRIDKATLYIPREESSKKPRELGGSTPRTDRGFAGVVARTARERDEIRRARRNLAQSAREPV